MFGNGSGAQRPRRVSGSLKDGCDSSRAAERMIEHEVARERTPFDASSVAVFSAFRITDDHALTVPSRANVQHTDLRLWF